MNKWLKWLLWGAGAVTVVVAVHDLAVRQDWQKAIDKVGKGWT